MAAACMEGSREWSGARGECAFGSVGCCSAPRQPCGADGPPAGRLPHYSLDIVLDTRRLLVRFAEEVTWTNRSDAPIDRIVFNAHAAYKIPAKTSACSPRCWKSSASRRARACPTTAPP